MEKEHSQAKSPFATEPIGRLIVKFAVPSVIALLVNSLYNIVDQIFIGWGVGYLGNGATNVVFPITIIALALSMMIGNGGAAYLSLKLGEGEVAAAKKGVGNATTLVTIVSIVLAVVFLASGNLHCLQLTMRRLPHRSCSPAVCRKILRKPQRWAMTPLRSTLGRIFLWTAPQFAGPRKVRG